LAFDQLVWPNEIAHVQKRSVANWPAFILIAANEIGAALADISVYAGLK
jgi:hypothetical protein